MYHLHMITLSDQQGRACIRLYNDWFVAYTEAKHLGWLGVNGSVYNDNGEHIGWLNNGVLQDESGKRVADDRGTMLPGMAGIPGRPGIKGFSGTSHSKYGVTSTWSDKTVDEFFGV